MFFHITQTTTFEVAKTQFVVGFWRTKFWLGSLINESACTKACHDGHFLATGEAEIRSSSMIRGSILSLTIISWRDRLSQKPKFQTNASFITCLFFFFLRNTCLFYCKQSELEKSFILLGAGTPSNSITSFIRVSEKG